MENHIGKFEKNTVNADRVSVQGYRFEPLAEANLSNNFLFVKVMSDPDILKPFLEMVLKIKIKKLRMTEYEKTSSRICTRRGKDGRLC